MKTLVRLVPNAHQIAVTGLAMTVLFIATNSAMAHAQLIKSNPPDKAQLKAAPTRVELWFNELLEQGFNSVEVFPASELSDKKHSNLAAAQPKVDAADKTHLSVDLSELKPGKYVIQYRVLSRDGHSAPGRLTFEIMQEK